MSALCILVAGPPAAGKTTFARWLGRRAKVMMLSKDVIKERLFDAVGFASRAEKVRLGDCAFRIMLDAAQSCLSAGQSCILESNFDDASVRPLADMLSQTGARAVTVLFDGDTRELYRRFIERDKSPERHPGHVVNDRYPPLPGVPDALREPLTFQAFENAVEARGYRRFAPGGAVMHADAARAAEADYEALYRAIFSALK